MSAGAEAVARIQQEMDALQRLSEDEFRARQSQRLADLIRFHFGNEPNEAYRRLLRSHGIEHESDLPRTVDDIGRLPITGRPFLQEGDFAARPCVSADQVRTVVETSGSSGQPLHLPLTHEWLRRSGELFTRSALVGGMDPAAPSYFVVHWVPGGKDNWASYQGTRAVQEFLGKERVLIASTHHTFPDHWHNLETHKPQWAMSAPVFFLALIGWAALKSIDLTTCGLRHLTLAGGTCRAEDRRLLEQTYGLERVHMFYGTTEHLIPAAELADGSGYLCFEDDYIVEVLDDDGLPVAEGKRGRVAITSLGNRSYPAIRYLQGDSATYVARSPAFPGCKIIKDLERVDAGEIGEARLLYSEIEMMPRHLLGVGVPVRALQIARRREGLKDVPVFRIETAIQDRRVVERAVLGIFTRNPQMRDMLEGGMIHPPVVELYAPGELTRGRFKVPVYVDERELQ